MANTWVYYPAVVFHDRDPDRRLIETLAGLVLGKQRRGNSPKLPGCLILMVIIILIFIGIWLLSNP